MYGLSKYQKESWCGRNERNIWSWFGLVKIEFRHLFDIMYSLKHHGDCQ